MGRYELPDHPVIACIERTGYPPWMQEEDEDQCEYDYDAAYEEQRDMELFGS